MSTSLLAAVSASLLFGVAAVLQAKGAHRATGLRILLHPMYLAGSLFDGVAWLLSILAMQHLPILAVQTMLAASLGVTVVLGAVFLGIRPNSRVWVSVGLIVSACVVVVAAAEPGRPGPAPEGFSWALAVTLFALVAVSIPAYRTPRTHWCALLSGLAYSGGAVAARALHGGSVGTLIAEPLVWLIGGFSAVGAVMYARALETRPDAVNEATAWLWTVEIVVPSIIGVLVLGDRVRSGWMVPAAIAVVAAVVATIRISASPSSALTPENPTGTGPSVPGCTDPVAGCRRGDKSPHRRA